MWHWQVLGQTGGLWVWRPRRWIRGPGHPKLATEKLPRLRPVESGITPTFFTVCLKRHVLTPAFHKLLSKVTHWTHNVLGDGTQEEDHIEEDHLCDIMASHKNLNIEAMFNILII